MVSTKNSDLCLLALHLPGNGAKGSFPAAHQKCHRADYLVAQNQVHLLHTLESIEEKPWSMSLSG